MLVSNATHNLMIWTLLLRGMYSHLYHYHTGLMQKLGRAAVGVATVFALGLLATGVAPAQPVDDAGPNGNADASGSIQYLVNTPVVELFTSQGCPNCPRADSVLAQLIDRRPVLALSVHVDYWDYTGWRDPYGSEGNTQRQMRYKQALDVPYVFTPQFVLNGRLAMESQALSGLEMALEMFDRHWQAISVALDNQDGHELIRLAGAELDGTARISFVFFDAPHDTVPTSGRNEGKHLVNANSVTRWIEVGEWDGSTMVLEWPSEAGYGCALIVSDAETGSVLATATRLDQSKI